MANQVCGYIDDGYTRRGYVAPVDTVHPGLRFEYRPLLTTQRAKIRKSIELAEDEARAEAIAAEAIAAQFVSWSLTDRRGNAVPIKPEHVLRVVPALFGSIWGIVMETRQSDIDPKWDDEEKAEASRRHLAEALGVNPAELEFADEKN